MSIRPIMMETDDDATQELWEPLVVTRAEIQERFEALESGNDRDRRGRRESLIVHPRSNDTARGLTPVTRVALGTLLPGESTVLDRDNAVGLAMCLAGEGTVRLGDRTIEPMQHDVWTKPTMHPTQLRNDGTVPFRYLSYSNEALLITLSSLYRDDQAPDIERHEPDGARAKDLLPPIDLPAGSGQLLPYEHLIDPDATPDRPLHFRWVDVRQHLSGVEGLGTGYSGRPLYCLYNPTTGRLNGTTPCYFATITSVGGAFRGPTHRHMSSAINYHFAGRGSSVVEGQKVDWEAGDLLLSAPAWGAHGHTIWDEGARILTVQDHPFHISTGSLVWQEDLDGGEIRALGMQEGFQTNIAEYV